VPRNGSNLTLQQLFVARSTAAKKRRPPCSCNGDNASGSVSDRRMMGYAVPRIAEWNPRSALGPSTFEQTVRRRFRPLLAGSLAKVFGSKRRVDVNNPERPKRIQHGIGKSGRRAPRQEHGTSVADKKFNSKLVRALRRRRHSTRRSTPASSPARLLMSMADVRPGSEHLWAPSFGVFSLSNRTDGIKFKGHRRAFKCAGWSTTIIWGRKHE